MKGDAVVQLILEILQLDLFILILFFETGSHCLALASLELTMKNKLALNSEHPVSAGIQSICHHTSVTKLKQEAYGKLKILRNIGQ